MRILGHSASISNDVSRGGKIKEAMVEKLCISQIPMGRRGEAVGTYVGSRRLSSRKIRASRVLIAVPMTRRVDVGGFRPGEFARQSRDGSRKGQAVGFYSMAYS